VDTERELVVGQRGLAPWFAKSKTLPHSTINARFEGIESKTSCRQTRARGQDARQRHSYPLTCGDLRPSAPYRLR
jgi:hypothetical protein